MKIALLGGSFNPLHIGHCMLADTVAKEAGYDKVLFIPLNLPSHKIIQEESSAFDRLSMVENFCKTDACDKKYSFEVEDCEIRRGGISYTYDTLIYILKKYAGCIDGKPAIVIGQESASQFEKWHNSNEIIKMADLIVARRHLDFNAVDISASENIPTGSYVKDFVAEDFETSFSYPHVMLKNPILPISSTEIRSRIAQGKSWKYLVPSSVFHYIIEHRLYGLN